MNKQDLWDAMNTPLDSQRDCHNCIRNVGGCEVRGLLGKDRKALLNHDPGTDYPFCYNDAGNRPMSFWKWNGEK